MLVTRNILFKFKAIFSHVSKGIPVQSENSTAWKSALRFKTRQPQEEPNLLILKPITRSAMPGKIMWSLIYLTRKENQGSVRSSNFAILQRGVFLGHQVEKINIRTYD